MWNGKKNEKNRWIANHKRSDYVYMCLVLRNALELCFRCTKHIKTYINWMFSCCWDAAKKNNFRVNTCIFEQGINWIMHTNIIGNHLGPDAALNGEYIELQTHRTNLKPQICGSILIFRSLQCYYLLLKNAVAWLSNVM